MSRVWKLVAAVVFLMLVAGAWSAWRIMRAGFSVHEEPGRMETMLASKMRRWSVPADLRDMRNPVAVSPDVLAEARAHFADHCASCHGNDGKGMTQIGQRLYPRAPDMTLAATQDLGDGELFAIIENGVRLSGMPGWGDGSAESAYGSWTLVHLIRHLPNLTAEEVEGMKALNPVSRAELDAAREEEAFLEGADDAITEPKAEHSGHQR